jgi:hypothetical protein
MNTVASKFVTNDRKPPNARRVLAYSYQYHGGQIPTGSNISGKILSILIHIVKHTLPAVPSTNQILHQTPE